MTLGRRGVLVSLAGLVLPSARLQAWRPWTLSEIRGLDDLTLRANVYVVPKNAKMQLTEEMLIEFVSQCRSRGVR